MNKSVVIVACYIGKLPWYFNYFLHSCRYNPTIDFVIINDDNKYKEPTSSNVRFVYATLSDLNILASKKLGLPVNITTGYKLCDFKPTYGMLFSDLIQGYDYWGHGDIDMVFGDIREFITDELLNQHDLISVRHDFLTGQFLLFRNIEKINKLFTLSRDYKRVLCSEKHYCFDETNFQWAGFTDGKTFNEIPSEVESMTHLVKRLEKENYLKVHFDFIIIEGVPGKLRWNRGKLFYKNKYEILLYHMVVFKKVCVAPKQVKEIPETFTISPARIYH